MQEGGTQCAVHIAETDEQKFSRRFTVAATRTATGDVLTADPASALRRNRFVGAGWSSSGQDRSQTGKVGEDRERPLYEEGVRSSYAELTLGNPECGVTWITSCQPDSYGGYGQVIQIDVKTLNASAELATGTNSRPTTSCA